MHKLVLLAGVLALAGCGIPNIVLDEARIREGTEAHFGSPRFPIDTGPIVAQVPVTVEEDDDVASLHERIKTAERAMLVDAVGRIARDGLSVEGRRVRIGARDR